MRHGTYIGPIVDLKGRTALILDEDEDEPEFVYVQFDDLSLDTMYTHCWQWFHASQFDIEEKAEWPE